MSLDEQNLNDNLQTARKNYNTCDRAFRKMIRVRNWLLTGIAVAAGGAIYLILADWGVFAIPIIIMITIVAGLSVSENIAHNESDRDQVLEQLRVHRNTLEYLAYRRKQMEKGKAHVGDHSNTGE